MSIADRKVAPKAQYWGCGKNRESPRYPGI
jgi:hypothetical protein